MPIYSRYSPSSRTDGTKAGPEGSGDLLRENLWFGPAIRLGGAVRNTPAHRTGDLGSNPGPDENFSLKLTISEVCN